MVGQMNSCIHDENTCMQSQISSLTNSPQHCPGIVISLCFICVVGEIVYWTMIFDVYIVLICSVICSDYYSLHTSLLACMLLHIIMTL